MRFGALLLLAREAETRPSVAGNIGGEGISDALKAAAKGKVISNTIASNEALGILTSDGLTTIDCKGQILSAGEIIDIHSGHDTQISGGGRTQAAVAASKYGLAIKISEDGPISLFKDGKLQIKFVR